ncbi:MAG: Com family DNA-binding transcriptional regulator [Clostridium sp.]
MINIEEVRCPKCNQLLLKADYIKGEIKCPRCRKIIKLEIEQRTEPRATP